MFIWIINQFMIKSNKIIFLFLNSTLLKHVKIFPGTFTLKIHED